MKLNVTGSKTSSGDSLALAASLWPRKFGLVYQEETMAGDPRETVQRIRNVLQQRARGAFGGGFGSGFGGGAGGGIPGGPALKPVIGFVVLGAGAIILSNSIFNGKDPLGIGTTRTQSRLTYPDSGWWTQSYQVYKGRRSQEGDLQ